MRTLARLALAGLSLALTTTSAALAQYSDEEMAKAMEMARPGPEHKLLEEFTGDWGAKITAHFDAANPVTGDGVTKNHLLLGGRFLQMDGLGEVFGMKTATMQIVGFDRRTSRYTLFGIDEMGTYSISAEGTYNTDGKSIDLLGVETDGTHRMEYRIRLTRPENGRYSMIFEHLDPSTKTYAKMVEVVNSRP